MRPQASLKLENDANLLDTEASGPLVMSGFLIFLLRSVRWSVANHPN